MGESPEIRVLDLLPGKEDDAIECEIRSTSLDTGVEYEALSYVWGLSLRNNVIRIDGREEPVTDNLYDALCRLRDPSSRRVLWIDQICINQHDPKEKTRQVNLMRLIYNRCSRCLVWLGEISENTAKVSVLDAEAAFHFLRLIALDPSNVSSVLVSDEIIDGVSNALKNMTLGNSWWKRIWTIQEATLPSEVIVLWGPLSIEWEVLDQAALNLCQSHLFSRLYSLLSRIERGVIDGFTGPVRGLKFAKDGENVLDMIQRWRHRGATDPRDKIYALMGLFPSMPLPNIQSCNYELSTAGLYTQVTFDLIQLKKSLKPLIGRRGEPAETENLPTWALDLTECKDDSKRGHNWWPHSFRYPNFAADGNRPLHAMSMNDGFTMSLKGMMIDKIAELRCSPRKITRGDVEIGETIRNWEDMLKESQNWPADGPYIGGGSRTNAFWRTLLGDLILEQHPVRKAVNSDFALFCEFRESLRRNEIYFSLCDMVVNQTFFVTEKGYIGLGPPGTRIGDDVFVLYGGSVPFVLRESLRMHGNFDYDFVGDAYVHGVMFGEAVKNSKEPPWNVWLH